MRAKMGGTPANLPGQEASLWGQLSQVPRWGSHSAGIRNPGGMAGRRDRGTVPAVDATFVRPAFSLSLRPAVLLPRFFNPGTVG